MSKKCRIRYWLNRTSGGQIVELALIFLGAALLICGIRTCFEPSGELLPRTIAEMVSPVEFNQLAHGTSGTTWWKTVWLFLIFSVGSVLFTGGIIAILSNWLRGRTERHRAGLTHYRQNGHYLILGYNELTIGLIKHLFEKNAGNNIDIVIQTTQSVGPLRKKIESQLTKKQCRHLFFVYASRDSENGYDGLYVTKANRGNEVC